MNHTEFDVWNNPVLVVILECFPDDVLAQLHKTPPNRYVFHTIENHRQLKTRVMLDVKFGELIGRGSVRLLRQIRITKRSFVWDASNTTNEAIIKMMATATRKLLMISARREILVFVDKDFVWATVKVRDFDHDPGRDCCEVAITIEGDNVDRINNPRYPTRYEKWRHSVYFTMTGFSGR
jgi:hypothetical protein